MNLILLEPGELGAAGDVSLSGARASHLRDVLGASVGQTVRIGLLDGPLGTGTVESIAGATIVVRCAFEASLPPLPPVDLLLALPRPKVLRRLWAQLAALGVGQIILTKAERVERNYFDTHVVTPECYRPLLIEGLQQARDTRVPAVSIHRQFKVLVEDTLDGLFARGIRLVADPSATKPVGALSADVKDRRVLLAIGPEGGWNDFERRLLEAHGFHCVGIGPRTLRTDTACVALLTLVNEAIRTQET